jgi:superoxide reductase
MANKLFRCEICGNIVELLHEGKGQLVCCGKPMALLEENTTDGATEKHVPVIENNRVRVGIIDHPMEEEHYIEWIEATDGKEISRVFLKPGQKPIAEFSFEPISAKEYCNLHGLWKSKE